MLRNLSDSSHHALIYPAVIHTRQDADKFAIMNIPPAEIMDMPLRPLIASLLLAVSLGAQAATEVIALQHRSSAELLPAAQSFIGKDGSVNTFEDKLIVNAPQPRIDDLRALLQQLDTAPKRMLISVDNSDSNFQDNRGNARVIQYGTANREGGLQQVQASEGQPALIQVGQSIPVTSTSTDGYGRLQSNTEYRNVTQGFYVTPRLSGDTVRLQISTNNDRMSHERPDVVKVQSTDTTITGKLGEWITLAGFNQQSQADNRASTLTYSTQRGENMTLRVKVDLLD
jgi:type II secretory pathway component GspD/PulD (secretin)